MNLALAQSRSSKTASAILRRFSTRSPVPAISHQSYPTPAIARCACGGQCPRCQAKSGSPGAMRLSQPGDPFEREADHVADQVMRMSRTGSIGSAPGTIQRKCKGCEEEEEKIQTKRQDSAPSMNPGAALRAVQGSSAPLPGEVRSYFEPRFGHDFSQVRVHADGEAALGAQAVQARAFTFGDHVVFGAGEYAPNSGPGRKLLAHELTHVVQRQRGGSSGIQRQGREGTSEFEEHVLTPPQLSNGVWTGNVKRQEFAPASGSQLREEISSATVPVEFDPSSCVVHLRHTYAFVAGDTTTQGICEDPPHTQPVAPVSAARLREIQTQYMQAVTTGLNNWYSVRLEGDGCESACAGQNIPIRVDPTVAAGGSANTTIIVVNRGGRADAGTICAPDFNAGTNVHEGGHQVLGVGDEYREEDPQTLARVPRWGRIERVRDTDWSYMGSHHSYGRFALFNERHFAHVPEFLRAVFPGCRARLVALSRPVIPDFRFGVGGGYARLGESNVGYFEGGLGMGIPLTRLREWELTLGAHGLATFSSDPHAQTAFLLGGRVGLEHTWTPSAGGVRLGGFAEAGHGWFRPGTTDRSPGLTGFSGAPYGELGLTAGYQFSGQLSGVLGLDAAAGTTLRTLPGASELPADEHTVQWFRLGVRAALEF
jgi:hypothetical protein